MGSRELTPRQLEIARLVHDGERPKTIAGKLGISHHTVITHMRIAARTVGGKGAPIVILTRYIAARARSDTQEP